MRRSGYQINPAGQGGVQHSDAAQAPNGISGGSSLLYSQINPSAAIVAGTETRFNKIAPISAGTLAAGCYVRYNAWGYYTVVIGTPQLIIISRLYNSVGSAISLLSSSLQIAAAPNGVAFVNWRVESGFVVHIAGSSGTFYAETGRSFYNRDSTLTLPTVISLDGATQSGFSVDIGQATVLGMSCFWTPSNASNVCVMTGSEVFIDYPAITS